MATEKIKLLTENVRILKSQHKPQTVVTEAINELKRAMAENQETERNTFLGYILGAGNPLLDISAVVEQELLDRYKLKLNNATLAEPKDLPLFDELVAKYKVEYIAGGATLNSIRVAQWMLQEPGATGYIGCIGSDKFGQTLRECAAKDGVALHVQEDKKTPTGTCAVLIKDRERCLVANLAAANEYKKTHFDTAAVQAVVDRAQLVYSAGFFLTVSPDTVHALGAACSEKNKLFAVNLSAPFITQVFAEPLAKALFYADFVFGNESEAQAFGAKDSVSDVKDVALRIAALPKANQRPRVVIITQGKDATIVAQGSQVVEYTVPPLKQEDIVDCNGAGDAFVGGYLAGLARGLGTEECVHAGHFAAAAILKVSGCKVEGQGKPSLDLKAVWEAVAKVRTLKQNKASQDEVKAAVDALVALTPRAAVAEQGETDRKSVV